MRSGGSRRYAYRLAWQMGVLDPEEMLRRMGSRTWAGWLAFLRAETETTPATGDATPRAPAPPAPAGTRQTDAEVWAGLAAGAKAAGLLRRRDRG